MIKKLATVLITISLSSSIHCMQSFTQRLRYSRLTATSLAGKTKFGLAVPQRTLIYKMSQIMVSGYYDHQMDPVDISPILKEAQYFGKIKLPQTSQLLAKKKNKSLPSIPDAYKNNFCIARLHYASRKECPEYFLFENNEDLKEIIDDAKSGNEITSSGQVEVSRKSKEDYGDSYMNCVTNLRFTIQRYQVPMKPSLLKSGKKIEFYALKWPRK